MDNLTAGNPLAHRVRVYYEGDNTIYEGMPLCYNFNTTKNWFGGSVSDGAVSATNTTAEGSHNEGKYIRVTEPISISETDHTHTTATSVITPGTSTDFDNVEVGMFVNVSECTGLTGGAYEVTAVVTAADVVADATLTEGITLSLTAAEIAAATDTSVTVALNNIHAFAGVVSKGGWNGKTGPRVLDIYVPNGAIVPVRAGVACTIDRTVLSVISATNYLGHALSATYSRPVAIAQETNAALSTAGLVLAKLDNTMFLHQISQGTSLLVGTGATVAAASQVLNYINVESAQTTGNFEVLNCQGTLTGTGAFWDGMYKFKATLNAAAESLVIGMQVKLNIGASGIITLPGYTNSVLQLMLSDTGSPNHDGGDISCLDFEYHLDHTGGAPRIAVPMHFHAGTNNFSALFNSQNFGDIGDGTVANSTTQESASDKYIPVMLANTVYYLRAYITAQ